MVEVLQSQWNAIAADPLAFILVALGVASLTALVIIWFMSERVETLKERIEGYKEENARLKGEKDHLLNRLDEHGENIDDIRRELKRLPQIHVSTVEPKDAKDGDLWILPEDKSDRA